MNRQEAWRNENFVEKVQPAAAATVSPLSHTRHLYVDTALLATLTINFPEEPVSSQPFTIFAVGGVTAVTLAVVAPGTATISNPPADLAALTGYQWIYSKEDDAWHRVR
jgi:hypothetical protein